MKTVRPTNMLAVVVFVFAGPAAHISTDAIQAATEVRRPPSTRTVTEEDNGARIILKVADAGRDTLKAVRGSAF
jgi:hypothetical protein